MRLGPEGCLVLACALLAISLASPVSAQTPRIGLLAWSDCDHPPLLRGLEELGYRPGETITIECRSADRTCDGLTKAASDLVGLGVDVIVGLSQAAGQAAHDATTSIPIVSIISGDPVAAGSSVRRPSLPARLLYRPHPERREARRSADRAADRVRALDQSETAAALGIELPPGLLLRADEVIE